MFESEVLCIAAGGCVGDLQDVMMNNEVQALKEELILLKSQFSERVEAVEQRLNILLAKELAQQQVENTSSESEPTESQTASRQEKFLKQSKQEDKQENSSAEQSSVQWQLAEQAEVPHKDPSPTFIYLFFKTLLSALFDWLSPLITVYHSYKERGMLGIFSLTLVGIALTLAGFGYLMQLLIDQLGVGLKVLLMSIAAVSVIGLGIIIKLKTRFSEFSTAIVTLGVLLSYSTVYFSGSVYGLLPNIAMLLLYLVVALTCHGLALWLDTKIVAGLGVIGIATMPILSNTLQLAPFYYLLSLAFIIASSLILAYRHTGRWLAQLSLAFTFVALEWILSVEQVQISAWLVDVFYLLFFAYVVVALFQNKDSSKSLLIFLSALVGATILLFFQASDVLSSSVSIWFSLNALLTIAVSYVFYKVRHQQSHFLILLAAIWSVLAVISAISDAYWGIAWAIEGLLLLFIGRQYLLPPVVNQGQVLVAIALLYSWSALSLYFPLPALKSLDGWLLSLVIVGVIAVWQRMINSSAVFNQLTLNRIKPALQWLEVTWLTILCLASAHLWLGEWTGAVFILVQLAILFRARYCQQISIEILAASLILVPLFYVYNGAMLVGSFRFTELPLFAQLSLLSAFVQLWLWSAFYRQYYPNSSVKKVAEVARILFYLLLPVCWLGSVIRRLEQDAVLLLWLSPLVALILSLVIKHRYLLLETKILTGLASLSLISLIAFLTPLNSVIALCGFILFYGVAYYQHKQLSQVLAEPPDGNEEHSPEVFTTLKNSLYKFICSWGLITLGIALPVTMGVYTSSFFVGFMFAAVYWVILFKLLPVSAHVRRNERTVTLSNFLLILSAWFLIQQDVYFALLPGLFIAACLYQKQTTFKDRMLGKRLGLNSDLFLHSIAVITYVLFCLAVKQYPCDLLIAPLLAVHGATILFVKDRRLTTVKYSFFLMLLGIVKLAFFDAANALLWQKVILFMGIGVFILAASFWYQKLVSKTV